MYFRYLSHDCLIIGSYMHFHSLNCPLCTIITIICLIMRMWIYVGWHILSMSICWRCSTGYVSHLSWLFTIIECLQHTGIWTTLRKYEIVLENAVLTTITRLVCTIDWANYFWSIILQILHESRLLSIVHDILRWLLLSLVWVVESWCSSIWTGAETTLIHLILFVHKYYTVILLVTLWIACFKACINCTSNWTSAIRELTSSLFVWLV